MVLTGREDSAQLLEGLERENLFLLPLDDDGGSDRYHPLFRELLRGELKRREPTASRSCIAGRRSGWRRVTRSTRRCATCSTPATSSRPATW